MVNGEGELVSGRWDLRKDSEVLAPLAAELLQLMVLFGTGSHAALGRHSLGTSQDTSKYQTRTDCSTQI
jgi:hypothetical protein